MKALKDTDGYVYNNNNLLGIIRLYEKQKDSPDQSNGHHKIAKPADTILRNQMPAYDWQLYPSNRDLIF